MSDHWEDLADWFGDDTPIDTIAEQLLKHPPKAVAWLAANLIHERNQWL